MIAGSKTGAMGARRGGCVDETYKLDIIKLHNHSFQIRVLLTSHHAHLALTLVSSSFCDGFQYFNWKKLHEGSSLIFTIHLETDILKVKF